jgi:hypothetical protein
MTAGCFALLNSNNKRMSVSVVATRFSGKGRSHPRSIADFYADVMRSLAELGINIRINELPNEIPPMRSASARIAASTSQEPGYSRDRRAMARPRACLTPILVAQVGCPFVVAVPTTVEHQCH